jgi:hypothetical protein
MTDSTGRLAALSLNADIARMREFVEIPRDLYG